MTEPLFTARGDRLILGKQLGRGGEGAVHALTGREDVAAKIYFAKPDQTKSDKLAVMTTLATPELLSLAAWPTETIHGSQGDVLGFVMPKIEGHRPVFELYGPKLRMQWFPKADWRFLVHAAANTARAFAAVHAAGHVIGDVNHGNLVVSANATVRFIDTDSFQVIAGGREWLCEVGVGTHQPPEMQALGSYEGIVRRPNQDNFGLAIILFQLLMLARHPFSGSYVGPGDPPDIEGAIRDGRYAFARDSARTQLVPPPSAPPISALSPQVQALFEAAFHPDAGAQGRPTAAEWLPALDELGTSLRRCGANPGHYHAPGPCPWCAVEGTAAMQLFPSAGGGEGAAGAGVAVYWQQIEAVASPSPAPPLTEPRPGRMPPSPPLRRAGKRRRLRAWLGLALAAAGAAVILTLVPAPFRVPACVGLAMLLLLVFPRRNGRLAFEVSARLEALEHEWSGLDRSLANSATGFHALRARLHASKQEYDALPRQRMSRMRQLGTDRRHAQLVQFLDRYVLSTMDVPGLARASVRVLQDYGIETAADISPQKLGSIPGFGPAAVASLISFRQRCEADFRYDDAAGIPPAEMAALDREIAVARLRLQTDLARGVQALRTSTADTLRDRDEALARAEGLRPDYAQALADARVLGLS